MSITTGINAQRRIRNEVELMWGSGGVAPSRRKHKGSGAKAPQR